MIQTLTGILQETWQIWQEAAVYLLFGFLMAGFIHSFIKTETIARHLGIGKVRPVFLAALFGIPLPLCSCGVVPAALSLKKSGANNGATLSFLISTPVSGVDSIALTYSLMDPLMTVARPVAGFLAAFTAGILENFFENSTRPEIFSSVHPEQSRRMDCCSSTWTSCTRKFLAGFRYAFVDLVEDIAGWFLIGMLVAGFISYLVPETWISQYLGGGLATMLIMLFVGIPLYICASASTPIAAALILKGMSPGAALVFLLAGSATNAASITVLIGMLGKRAIIIYLTVIAVFSVGCGLLLDKLYVVLNIQPTALSGTATHIFPHSVMGGASLLLALVMAFGLYHHFHKKA